MFGFSYLTSIVFGWLGLKRRGLLAATWVLLLTPVHWLLVSLAAWRALYQLVVSPYVWEKTEHGLAKNSRLASRTTRSARTGASSPAPQRQRAAAGAFGRGPRPTGARRCLSAFV